MTINTYQFGYMIRSCDATRHDALKIAITVYGVTKVLDHLEDIKIKSSAYGSNQVCVNITQRMEKHYLKLTERDIAYVENVAARVIQTKWRHYITDVKNEAAGMIQKKWRQSIADPTYYACRQRLAREFNEL